MSGAGAGAGGSAGAAAADRGFGGAAAGAGAAADRGIGGAAAGANRGFGNAAADRVFGNAAAGAGASALGASASAPADRVFGDAAPGAGLRVEAVLCDLDDTLFPQQEWLDGAWEAVAAEGARFGVDEQAFLRALRSIAAEGSARGGIIDRALAAVAGDGSVDSAGAAGTPGVDDSSLLSPAPTHPLAPTAPLVAVFRAHRPPKLAPYPGVPEALTELRAAGLPLALVTDGDIGIQQAKLDALGLADRFDVVVLSDRLGRDRRKPHPAPFLAALEGLRVPPGGAVFVGDRPDKDVIGAAGCGIRAIRVRTGEYSKEPDPPETWCSVPTFAEAARRIVEGC